MFDSRLSAFGPTLAASLLLLVVSHVTFATARDRVLTHAARIAGHEITPEQAGTLFPVEWRK